MRSGRLKISGKRSSDMIIAQILEACIGGASKTKIVYQANLNFSTVNPYIDLLVKRSLIVAVRDNRLTYKTTDNGIQLMKMFKHHQNEISKLWAAIDDANENCF